MQTVLAQQRSFRTAVPRTRFVEFLEHLRQELELADIPEEGVHELRNSRGDLALAVSTKEAFVAARFEGTAGVCEAFFVCPADKAPQCGIRGSFETPSGWWRSFVGSDVERAQTSNPSFLQLACLLASDGRLRGAPQEVATRVHELESEVAYLQPLMREQGDEIRRLKAELRALANTQVGEDLDEVGKQALPTDLGELAAWCANHEGRIIVLPRARKGAKKSVYEHPEHIFEALELLAGPYRELHTGMIDAKAFESILNSSSLKLERSVSPSVAGEQGDAYFVAWGGRRRFLEYHLVKGGGFNERFCMRVYFFWDEALERVVVGAMPQHLNNSLT